jgi:outer membrane protein with beta-barrel domain
MRYCLLLICVWITFTATAQFNMNFYTQAGGNYTTIRIPRTTGIETSNGGYGWQLGIGTEYYTSFGYFIYLGIGVRNEVYNKDSTSAFFPDTVSKFKYKPLFLSIPFGIGLKLPLEKKLSLKIYAGLNIQVGVSGKVTKRKLYYTFDSATQQTVLTKTDVSKHDIRFGRNSDARYAYDYNNSNWGAHIGAGIELNNSFELNVFYHYGFTNFLPDRDAAVEINKLSFIEVNARIYLPDNYIGTKKKSGRNGY